MESFKFKLHESVDDDIKDDEERGRAQTNWPTAHPDNVGHTGPVVVMIFGLQGEEVADCVWKSLRVDGDGDILSSSWWSQTGV